MISSGHTPRPQSVAPARHVGLLVRASTRGRPGGGGTSAVSMLLRNCCESALARRGLELGASGSSGPLEWAASYPTSRPRTSPAPASCRRTTRPAAPRPCVRRKTRATRGSAGRRPDRRDAGRTHAGRSHANPEADGAVRSWRTLAHRRAGRGPLSIFVRGNENNLDQAGTTTDLTDHAHLPRARVRAGLRWPNLERSRVLCPVATRSIASTQRSARWPRTCSTPPPSSRPTRKTAARDLLRAGCAARGAGRPALSFLKATTAHPGTGCVELPAWMGAGDRDCARDNADRRRAQVRHAGRWIAWGFEVRCRI